MYQSCCMVLKSVHSGDRSNVPIGISKGIRWWRRRRSGGVVVVGRVLCLLDLLSVILKIGRPKLLGLRWVRVGVLGTSGGGPRDLPC